MGIVLLVVAALVVLVIAAVAVGKVVGETSGAARQSVFDLDEAVDFVADRLPVAAQARLTHDDVRCVIGWHLDFLEARGVAYERDDEREDAASPGVNVLDDDEMVGWVLGRASEAELDLTDVDVLLVLEEEMRYLEAIGAVGASVAEPEPGIDPGA